MTENEVIEELSNELRMITGIISYCRDFENNNDLALAYRIKRQKAMEAAISALKEIQQYQEIGTVEECRNIILKHMNDGWIPVEERLQAVLSCLDGGQPLGDVAQAYQVEVQTLRGWVKKYRKLGAAGLEDRRGHRLANQTPRSPDEALRIENARLKQENELLKMELYLRKKVKALERGER